MAAGTSPERLELSGLGILAAGDPAVDTIVFLHGWSGSKELWWNALQHLSDAFYCLALDLPGTGETQVVQERTMHDMAAWVAQACTRLDVSRITLVGHSLGGNLAAQTALDHPGLVRRLVLVDAALETRHLPRRAFWTLSPRYGMAALRLARTAAWPLTAIGRRVPHTHSGGFWLPYARRTHLYVTRNTDQALQHQLHALTNNPLDASHLASLPMPVLLIHGAKDDIIPIARAKAMVTTVPQLRLVVVSRAHHCPMDTDPQEFARILRTFTAEGDD